MDRQSAFARRKAGQAVFAIIQGLQAYADAHKAMYESPIADDGVLGTPWQDIARGTLALLNGELGEYDGGTLDHIIRTAARLGGFKEEEL